MPENKMTCPHRTLGDKANLYHPSNPVSELEVRIDRAKKILTFIMGKYEGPTRFEDDIKRVYNVLAHGAKYARMYRTKKD